MDKLFRITLDTNPEDCNLNCMMCEEHSAYSDFKERLYKETGSRHRRMPESWIRDLFDEAKSLGVKEIIPSTMGEPLLYKHIDKFFKYAAEYDIKINLTTNGTFPGRSVEEWAELIIPVTSDTKISLNGATAQTAESVMKGLNFEQQINHIRRFTEFRNAYFEKTGIYSRITFQLTFMKSNMHELAGIIKLAAELDVDRIKGHHLWTHFDEIKHLSFKNDKATIKEWNVIVEEALNARDIYLRPNGSKVLLEQIDILSNKENNTVPFEYECPFLNKELWISAIGKISPCCAPDDLRKVLGNFGTYPENKLIETLESKNYQDLIKNYKNKSLCKTCLMRKP